MLRLRFFVSFVSLAIVLPTMAADNKTKTPPKKTPPNQAQRNRQMQQQAQRQAQYWNWAFSQWLNSRAAMAYNNRWNYPAYAGLLPAYGMPLAGLMPNYNPTTPAPSGPSRADLAAMVAAAGVAGGVEKEFTLQVAGNASVSALQAKAGGGTVYIPSKIDALKANSVVTVLVKSKEADKPATYTITGTVTDPGEGTDREIVVKAKVSPMLADLDTTDKVVTAVTIRSIQPIATK
jgi:hypothetical protein